MRLSAVTAALLLAFGVWGAASATPDLQFTDTALAMPAGDAMRGEGVYEASCTGCHSLDANRVGPAHRGVVGRVAGTAPMFSYSPALKASGLTWTPENLNTWLTNPQAFVKGVRMGFRLSDPQKRADVIAYLAKEGSRQ
jgi:cytochrome c